MDEHDDDLEPEVDEDAEFERNRFPKTADELEDAIADDNPDDALLDPDASEL